MPDALRLERSHSVVPTVDGGAANGAALGVAVGGITGAGFGVLNCASSWARFVVDIGIVIGVGVGAGAGAAAGIGASVENGLGALKAAGML